MPALRYSSLFVCALFASVACGQAAPSAPAASIGWAPWQKPSAPLAVSSTPHPAVARITVQERDGVAFGSGTLVDVHGDQGLVITNWHVVRDASGDIEVAFPDGYRSKAKVLKTDRDWDLAALVIWKPTVAPVPLSATAPQPGETLTIAGYGSGNFRAATARCTQYVSPGRSLPFEMVEVSAEARQGDSGGPILNDRGEVAGVLFGAGGGTTSGSYVGRVRTFLATVSPKPADPTAMTVPENIASTNPFVNPRGVPYLVQEANARTPAGAPAASPEGWHAKAAEAAPAAEDTMQAIIPTTPRVEVPSARFASNTKTQITFGSLPEHGAPAELALADDVRDSVGEPPARLWARPLPPPAEPTAPPVASGPKINATAASAAPLQGELAQSLLGTTLFEQCKSLFAVLGVLAIAVRFLRSPAPSE